MSSNPYQPPRPTKYDQTPTQTRWIIFAMACFASFLTYIHRYSWGAASPYLQKEYGLKDTEMGWLDSAFNLTYALGQFPGGLAGDVLGPRLMIPASAILWSIAVAGPALVTTFGMLLVSRLLFGAAQAPCYPNLGKITKAWFPLSVRTSIQGTVASFSGRAGAGVAPFLVGTVLIGMMHLSWQQSLYSLASVGAVFAIAFWFLFRNRPTVHPWSNEAERHLIESDEAPDSKTEPEYRFSWTPSNCLNLFFFLCASFCSTAADNLFVFWMPRFLVQEKGFSPFEMGIFASLPLWGGAIGGLCGGLLNDFLIRTTGNRRLARSLVASTGKVLAAVLIVVSLMAQDGRVVMAVLFFCKFFSDWSQPTWWGTVTDIGGPAAGRVFGLVNTFGSLGATAIGPVMGYIKQYHGWNALFFFVGVVYILTAVFWALVNCTKKLVIEGRDNL